MKLPPYAENATCPKCGHDDINVSYSKGTSFGALGCAYYCSLRGSIKEHLDRTCNRCHYQWAESVIEPVNQQEV